MKMESVDSNLEEYYKITKDKFQKNHEAFRCCYNNYLIDFGDHLDGKRPLEEEIENKMGGRTLVCLDLCGIVLNNLRVLNIIVSMLDKDKYSQDRDYFDMATLVMNQTYNGLYNTSKLLSMELLEGKEC